MKERDSILQAFAGRTEEDNEKQTGLLEAQQNSNRVGYHQNVNTERYRHLQMFMLQSCSVPVRLHLRFLFASNRSIIHSYIVTFKEKYSSTIQYAEQSQTIYIRTIAPSTSYLNYDSTDTRGRGKSPVLGESVPLPCPVRKCQ